MVSVSDLDPNPDPDSNGLVDPDLDPGSNPDPKARKVGTKLKVYCVPNLTELSFFKFLKCS